MPELPEVETIRLGLSKLLPGKKIVGVWHDWPRGFPNAQSDVDTFLINAHVVEVKRRAKVLIIELDTKYSLVIHLKMTGQLVYVEQKPSAKQPAANYHTQTSAGEVRFGAGHPNDSLIGSLPDKSTRVIFDLEDAKLFFNDQRKFGWVRLMPTLEVLNIDFMRKLGPEPLSADFSWEDLKQRLLRRPKTNIKAALLDQTVIAGVGNIYADESLFAAKIHPLTLVKNLSGHKIKKLHQVLREILELSIEKGGSTDRNYVDAEGNKGSYLQFAQVFRKNGQPCNRCGTTIQKTRVAGRGTHICPKCQNLTK